MTHLENRIRKNINVNFNPKITALEFFVYFLKFFCL